MSLHLGRDVVSILERKISGGSSPASISLNQVREKGEDARVFPLNISTLPSVHGNSLNSLARVRRSSSTSSSPNSTPVLSSSQFATSFDGEIFESNLLVTVADGSSNPSFTSSQTYSPPTSIQCETAQKATREFMSNAKSLYKHTERTNQNNTTEIVTIGPDVQSILRVHHKSFDHVHSLLASSDSAQNIHLSQIAVSIFETDIPPVENSQDSSSSNQNHRGVSYSPTFKQKGAIVSVVGEIKAYLYERDTKRVIDLTSENWETHKIYRLPFRNHSTGEMYIESEEQDKDKEKEKDGACQEKKRGRDKEYLSQITTVYVNCDEEDVIIILSEGLWKNFDPRFCGISPKHINLNVGSWTDELTPKDIERRNFALRSELSQVISKRCSTAHSVADQIYQYILSLTKIQRSYIEEKETYPSDLSQYPGYLSHGACIALKATHRQISDRWTWETVFPLKERNEESNDIFPTENDQTFNIWSRLVEVEEEVHGKESSQKLKSLIENQLEFNRTSDWYLNLNSPSVLLWTNTESRTHLGIMVRTKVFGEDESDDDSEELDISPNYQDQNSRLECWVTAPSMMMNSMNSKSQFISKFSEILSETSLHQSQIDSILRKLWNPNFSLSSQVILFKNSVVLSSRPSSQISQKYSHILIKQSDLSLYHESSSESKLLGHFRHLSLRSADPTFLQTFITSHITPQHLHSCPPISLAQFLSDLIPPPAPSPLSVPTISIP